MAPSSSGGGPPAAERLELLRRLLAEAEELYRRGDLRRAGERYWRVVLALLETAAGIKRGAEGGARLQPKAGAPVPRKTNSCWVSPAGVTRATP